jgi:hypothetical protein
MNDSVEGLWILFDAFDAMDLEDFSVLEHSPLGVSLAVREMSFEVLTQLRTQWKIFARTFPPQDMDAFRPIVCGESSADGPLEAHKRHQAGVERILLKVKDDRCSGRLGDETLGLLRELARFNRTLTALTRENRSVASLLQVHESVAFLTAPQDLLQPVAGAVLQALNRACNSGLNGHAPDWCHSRPALKELIGAVLEYWDPEVHGGELFEPFRVIHSVLVAWKEAVPVGIP